VIAFLDASALIDLVEGEQVWAAAVKEQLRTMAAMAATSGARIHLATSRLSWLECRVGPLRRGDATALERFDGFFARPDLQWVELTAAVVEHATHLRAHHNLRTPDALQAASCLQLGPTAILLTGDAGFQRVTDLQVALISGDSGGGCSAPA
jgi:predicted nucleic acid-binding protein